MTASYTAACTYDMYRLPSIWNFAGAAARTVFTAIRFQSSAAWGEIVAALARDRLRSTAARLDGKYRDDRDDECRSETQPG